MTKWVVTTAGGTFVGSLHGNVYSSSGALKYLRDGGFLISTNGAPVAFNADQIVAVARNLDA